jgi:hypothetical protein
MASASMLALVSHVCDIGPFERQVADSMLGPEAAI